MGWPQVLMAVGSYLLNSAAQGSAQRKQDNLAQQMRQFDLTKTKASTDAINKFLDSAKPEARAQDMAQGKADTTANLNDAIGTSQAYLKPSNFQGKVTSSYADRAGSDAASAGQRIKAAIDQLSTINAPHRQNFDQSLRYGLAAGDVDAANSGMRDVNQAFQTDMSNVRPDPFLSLASQVLSGVNMASSLGAFKGLGGGAPSEVTLTPGVPKLPGLKPPTAPAIGFRYGGV
jgi:hypothetical protein